jgi:lysophospholipid acyltransferase (LPLAT)-like uncharacterized protein
MKDGFWYNVSLRLVPWVFEWLIRLWFSTCPLTIHGQEHRDGIKAAGSPLIASFWHYGVLYVLYFFREESGVAMVSASRDGEYISRIVERLGNRTVRGSRRKGGMQAIIKLIREVRAGHNTILVADGSQGPARVAQAGTVLLASHTGVPVLPLAWSCSRHIRFGSWDGTALPLPFSRVDFFYGEPLLVPPGLKEQELEEYRLELEKRLNLLYSKAWALQGKDEH